VASIDEGWTRWILEKYGFAPASLYNADVQAGHLRDRFNAIIIPDVSRAVLMDGFKPGTIPGEYAGGLGETGTDALRDFVRSGGTLVAFNNASSALIDVLKLPVTNILEGLKSEQFFCSGALLRVELRDPNRPAVLGLLPEPIVMFERGPAFEPRTGFQGAVLASYPRDRNPLESGFLLHPERIQGKAAAIEVTYGKGRVFLFGFKPQWRAQSHGTYKLIFNTLYEYEQPVTPSEPSKPRSPQAERWTALTEAARADLTKLMDANHAFFAAHGSKALEESGRLEAVIRQFNETRLTAMEDFRQEMEDRALARKIGEYIAQWKRLLADARTKDLAENATTADRVAEQYRLTGLEEEIRNQLAKTAPAA
jgi:hypothetical protein